MSVTLKLLTLIKVALSIKMLLDTSSLLYIHGAIACRQLDKQYMLQMTYETPKFKIVHGSNFVGEKGTFLHNPGHKLSSCCIATAHD